MEDLWRAIALLLILEGLMPTLMPRAWRETLVRIAHTNTRTIRLFGIVAVAAGALMFHFLR